MSKIIILPKAKQERVLSYMPEQVTLNKLADFFSVFSDSTRIKILTALCLNEMCVNDLAILLNINQTTVSHQLKFLRHSGAVNSRRCGKIIYYSVSGAIISEVMLSGVNYLLSQK